MPNHVWHDDDLRGAQFKRVDLSDAEFRDVNLTRARIVDAVVRTAPTACARRMVAHRNIASPGVRCGRVVWFFHAVLGEPRPYHEMGLLPAFLEAQRGALSIDPDASPSFEGVLEVRHKQMLRLRDFLEAVEPAELRANQRGNDDGLYPPTSHHTVLQCLHVVLDEEWNHHQYAARDLATVNGVTAS